MCRAQPLRQYPGDVAVDSSTINRDMSMSEKKLQ